MSDALPPDTPASPPLPPHRRRLTLGRLLDQLGPVRSAIVGVAGVGAILGGLVGYWNAWQVVANGAPTAATGAPALRASALSVVVLPFANLTGDASQAYVADGLTASLTADLSRIRDATVVAPTTAFFYKDRPTTAQQVGKELGVRYVLQGNVQRGGDRIRINAQLADTAANQLLWTDTFEGDPTDLFSLQDQVTTRIGNSIGREMVIRAARESETRHSKPRVADLLLRARALEIQPDSPAHYQQIEAWCRQALALEPGNTEAMVLLARALALEPSNFVSGLDAAQREKKFTEARDLALLARATDPDNPGIYAVLGFHASAHGDIEGARRAAETRQRLQPRDPIALNDLAITYDMTGEYAREVELLTQAYELEPRHPSDVILVNLGAAWFALGDNAKAIEWLLRAQDANTSMANVHAYLAMAYAMRGERDKAQASERELHRVDPRFTLASLKPPASAPSAARAYVEERLVPAARQAGLPD